MTHVKRMLISADPQEVRVAIVEGGKLSEAYIERRGRRSIVGNIYKGRVDAVLPGMEAAFVDIGLPKNGFLYVAEIVLPELDDRDRRSKRIQELIQSGQDVLVQVTKDPMGTKGARLTMEVSLAGCFMVLVPGGDGIGISRKLSDAERDRLRDLIRPVRTQEDAGMIVRTAAEGASVPELERDVRLLEKLWEVTRGHAERAEAPALVYAEPDLSLQVIRDDLRADVSEVVVDDERQYHRILAYVNRTSPELAERIKLYRGKRALFQRYEIEQGIRSTLRRRVELPSGGSLIFDYAEAFTIVDVNTGRFTGKKRLEDTILKNNLEAAVEVVRQLRLRDIGGIIVIDFIDMVLESNRDLVLRRLTECLGRDRTRHQVAEVTSLGLVQMTRKRVGVGLLEAFSTPCEHCRGRGVVVSTDPVEPKGDQGQQNNAGGSQRRRGRGDNRPADNNRPDNRGGGDNRSDSRGGDNRSDNRGGDNRGSDNRGSDNRGDHGDGNGNNGHSRRGRGGPADVANGHDRGSAQHDVPNGRPVPSAPAREAEAVQEPEPAHTGRPTTEPVEAADSTPSRHAAEPAQPAAQEAVEAPGQVAPAGVSDVTGPAPSSLELSVPTEPSLVPDNPSSAIDANSVSTDEEHADQAVQHDDWEPVSIGAAPERAARPARRRRRVASRPAGPPAGGEGGPDPV